MNIIVLSSNEELRDSMTAALSDNRERLGITELAAGCSGISADPAKYAAAVIASPLEDGFGLETAARFIENGGAGVVFVTSAANAEKASQRVKGYPVMIIPRPLNRFMLGEAVRCILLNAGRMNDLREKNAALEKKIGEIKLVNRAKAVMMKYLSLTEAEAHRQIQQRAMDQRRTLAQTAADIIRTYEYLN